jgi:hypothetical protein
MSVIVYVLSAWASAVRHNLEPSFFFYTNCQINFKLSDDTLKYPREQRHATFDI